MKEQLKVRVTNRTQQKLQIKPQTILNVCFISGSVLGLAISLWLFMHDLQYL
ncbi:MAG: hypothetical protein AAGD28_20620 [Bacteroidota bacterium]